VAQLRQAQDRLREEEETLRRRREQQEATAAEQADQAELLVPYAEKYFASIERLWAERTNETAQNIVIGFFPTLLAEQSTVDTADAWLAGHRDAAPALRRLVLEARDGVARALRAQERDART
jgi:aminopeptidase N